MNPMIGKELRLHMREKRSWLLLTLYLLVLSGVVLLTYSGESGREKQGAEVGLMIFLVVAFTQLGLLLLLTPVLSAGRVTIEKEQKTLPGLLTSLLSPAQIWWGKYAAAMLHLCLLLVSSLPVLGLTFGLGGVGAWDVVKVMGGTLLVLAALCSMGLWCSTYFRQSVHATAVSYTAVIILSVLTLVVYQLMGPSGGFDEPSWTQIALQLNPFMAVAGLVAPESEFDWQPYVPLMYYAGMGLLAAAAGIRRIGRLGEEI